MQSEFQTYAVDLDRAGSPSIGQEPITFHEGSARDGGVISYLSVQRYGRFGNNLYQVINAYWIAKALHIPTVFLEAFDFVSESVFLDVEIKPLSNFESCSGSGLRGSFYAPLGFETIFRKAFQSNEDFLAIRDMLVSTYRNLVVRSDRRRSIALHFRAGDIFGDAPHFLYVQPPASYYLKCFDHAIKNADYEMVELVYEDRSNPAIDIVEQALTARGIVFESRSATVGGDLSRLLSADCIISSFGTFCESVGFLSKYLRCYYCFRDLSSQSDLRPFSQSWTAPLLLVKSAQIYICDDYNFNYIRARCWANAAEQRDEIRFFPAENLRIYRYN